jgi:hypothetical protein
MSCDPASSALVSPPSQATASAAKPVRTVSTASSRQFNDRIAPIK